MGDRLAPLARLPIPAGPDDVTPEWLTAALGEGGVLPSSRVADAKWERVGADYGFTGLVARVHLGYNGGAGEQPGSLIAKLPMAETADMSGYRAVQERDPVAMRRYYERAAREVRFYREVGAAFAPTMYYADSDDGNRRVVLLLEDLSGGRQGDGLAGCSIADAVHVMEVLAPFHARWWGERASRLNFPRARGDLRGRQERYAQQAELFLAQYGDALTAAVIEIISGLRFRLAAVAEALYSGPETLIHADLHLDNMIFDPPGDPRSVIVLDWQTVSVGPPASDLRFFLSDSLSVEDRRAAETTLFKRYATLLAANGVRNYSVEELRSDCGRALLLLLAGTIGWLMNMSGDDLTVRERALQNAAITDGRLVAALLDYNAGALID
jgi:Phosphotransferase enzyme family